MTLPELFEETSVRRLTVRAVVAGNVLDIQPSEIQWSFNIGTVPICRFRVPNPPPDYMVELAPVSIHVGFNGLTTPIFAGKIESVSPAHDGCDIECAGRSRDLEGYQSTVISLNSTTANAAVESLLVAAGISYYVVDLPSWTIGAVVPQTLEFQTYGEAINKIAQVDGSPWYEMPDGQIRVEVRDPVPGPSAFREYFSGTLDGRTSTQPSGVSNSDALPRLLSIRSRKLLREVANKVRVFGAVVETAGPNGEVSSDTIEAETEATSPWVPTPPGTVEFVFNNELIDTELKAASVALRHLGLHNRLIEEIEVGLPGDPEVFLGATVKIIDPNYSRVNASYVVFGYESILTGSEFTTILRLRGGASAGSTPQIAPFAAFNWITDTSFKVKQPIPDIAGNPVLVTYDGGASRDFDGSIVSYAWSDTEGNTGSGRFFTVAYDSDAVTTVDMTLTVTDNDGLTDAITRTVNIPESSVTNPLVTARMSAAATSVLMESLDAGGWRDYSKAQLGVSGDIIHLRTVPHYIVQTDSAGKVRGFTNLGSGSAHVYGTDTGEVGYATFPSIFQVLINDAGLGPVRSIDGTILLALPIATAIFAAAFENVAYFLVAYSTNFMTPFVANKMAGDVAGAWSVGLIPGTQVPINKIKLAGGVFYSLGGDTSDPASLIRSIVRVPGSTGIEPPPFTGSILAAIQAAGPGASLIDVDIRPSGGLTIMFDTAVEPRIWYHTGVSGTEWQASSGLPAGVDGVAFATTQAGAILAVLDSLTAYYASDGIAFVAVDDAPSQINDIIAEPGLAGVFLGAADGAIVKTLDAGSNIGEIRPHTLLGTTWPAGAIGRDIDVYMVQQSQAPAPLLLVGTANYQEFRTAAWDTLDATPSANGRQLKYFGSGLGLHVDGADLWRTQDYGQSWTQLTLPVVPGAGGKFIAFDRGPTGRLWAAFGTAANAGSIYSSDDDGDNWTLRNSGFNVNSIAGLSVHPVNPSRVSVLYESTADLYHTRTTSDAGANWTDTQANADTLSGNDETDGAVMWLATDRLVVCMTTWNGGAFHRIRYSDDDGATYTTAEDISLSSSTPIAARKLRGLLRCTPFGPLFVVLDRDTDLGVELVWRSPDGQTWTGLDLPIADSQPVAGMAYDPIGDRLFFVWPNNACRVVAGAANRAEADWLAGFSDLADPVVV